MELALGVIISRRTIKHIVDSRKADGYDASDLRQMLARIPEVIFHPDVIISNTNQKYVGSFIVAKLYTKEKRALLVVEVLNPNEVRIISAYYRGQKRFEKFKGSAKGFQVNNNNVPLEGRNGHVLGGSIPHPIIAGIETGEVCRLLPAFQKHTAGIYFD